MLIHDQDVGGGDDLIDRFMIPVNTTAARTVYTGIHNYTQLELSIAIEVMCDSEGDRVVDRCGINCKGGYCVNEVTGPRCNCNLGFIGDYCNETDHCASSGCENGICVNQDDSYRCDCDPGFTGIFCKTNIDDCIGITCNNGGTCRDSVGDYHCECSPGFTGAHCEDIINNCSGVTCSGRGKGADSGAQSFFCTYM